MPYTHIVKRLEQHGSLLHLVITGCNKTGEKGFRASTALYALTNSSAIWFDSQSRGKAFKWFAVVNS